VQRILENFNELRKCGDNPIKQKGYVYVILGIIMENIGFEAADRAIDTNLSSQILFYINENYKNDISLDTIAAEFGYNPSYISRYFKSCFNSGISQYITMIRLKQAVMLMQDEKKSITYCALESGFNSMRSFYRAFANEFHCTPKEYIEKTLN
jgi:AraC-like DNA-binding protein